VKKIQSVVPLSLRDAGALVQYDREHQNNIHASISRVYARYAMIKHGGLVNHKNNLSQLHTGVQVVERHTDRILKRLLKYPRPHAKRNPMRELLKSYW